MTTRLVLVVLTITLVSSCSPLTSLLGGGSKGPAFTAVGTQMAKEANQQVVNDQRNIRSEGGDIAVTELEDTVQTKDVGTIKINNQDIPPWVILLLILGWLLPSPSEMGRGLASLIRRKA